VKIPSGLSSIDAAPLFCAGVTVYRALKRANVQAGQRLAVFGIGGLGHLAIQIASGMGANVTAIDVSVEKLAHARSLGASTTLNTASENVVKEVRRGGGMHVVLVSSAAKAAYDTALPCVRPGGKLLVVGLPAEPLCFPALLMAALEVRIQATSVGTREDVRELLALAAAGEVRCQVAARPLAQANEVMKELREGRVAGRIVLTPR
jgi:propanol-preferring alcohol dehydrogenase